MLSSADLVAEVARCRPTIRQSWPCNALVKATTLCVAITWLPGCADRNGTGESEAPAADSISSALVGGCLTEQSLTEHLEFASQQQAAEVLSRQDDWARQLSTFEMLARQRTLDTTGVDAFLDFLGSAARPWTAPEQVYWQELVEALSASMAGLNLTMADVFMVKTTGEEEFGFAYHRNGGIVIPAPRVQISGQDERRDFFLLAHEMFHYLGALNPTTRDTLFGLLDFRRIDGFELPAALEGRRLSNPDGHTYRHALSVQYEGREIHVIPAILSTLPLEEVIDLPTDGRPVLLSEIEVVLIPVDTATGRPLQGPTGDARVYSVEETDWNARTQRNTSYSIHPEEVLADNFALLMEWRRSGTVPIATPGGFPVNDVDLLRSIEATLTDGCLNAPDRQR